MLHVSTKVCSPTWFSYVSFSSLHTVHGLFSIILHALTHATGDGLPRGLRYRTPVAFIMPTWLHSFKIWHVVGVKKVLHTAKKTRHTTHGYHPAFWFIRGHLTLLLSRGSVDLVFFCVSGHFAPFTWTLPALLPRPVYSSFASLRSLRYHTVFVKVLRFATGSTWLYLLRRTRCSITLHPW